MKTKKQTKKKVSAPKGYSAKQSKKTTKKATKKVTKKPVTKKQTKKPLKKVEKTVIEQKRETKELQFRNIKLEESLHYKLKLQAFARKIPFYEYVNNILEKELKRNSLK